MTVKKSKDFTPGWAKVKGIPNSVLDLIGWEEYIANAARPYPEHLLNTEKNRENNIKSAKRIKELKGKLTK